jgi:general secretion pathway protein C
MKGFLRKYFWSIHLLTIGICAFFSARAVGRLVEANLTPTAPRKVAPLPTSFGEVMAAPSSRDITSILERNIFCSTCERAVELQNQGVEENTHQPANNQPVKSSLSLKLIATLVSEEDKAWSFAAIMDGVSNKTRLLGIGARVQEGVTLTDVLDRRAMLLNGNRNEYLELEAGETKGAGESRSTSAEPAVAQDSSGLSGMEDEVGKSIRKVGEGRYELERTALNKVLANTTLLARSARIVPSVQNGKPSGFKLYAIRPGSLYSMLGMSNGDTINAINGHPITTPDTALDVYTKLRNASHVTISFTRSSKTITNEYTIR